MVLRLDLLLLFVGELAILFVHLGGQPLLWAVSFETQPRLVVRVPGVDDLIAQVPPGHLPYDVRIVFTAVRAGCVVGVDVHRLPTVALDQGVCRHPLVVLDVGDSSTS